MKLTNAQWQALAHVCRHGFAKSLGGGLWSGEPEKWERGNHCIVDGDYAIRAETIDALARRRLIRHASHDRVELTKSAETLLLIRGYEIRNNQPIIEEGQRGGATACEGEQ